VSLRQEIVQEIRERGPIPFSRYMEQCLYHPQSGYYSRSTSQFGKAGDFYTSSDVHAVFGRLLARQFEEMWRVLGSPAQIEVVELGPGRGLFAQDVLDWSGKKFPEFFAALHYSLAERSPALRMRIEETLQRHLAAGKASLWTEGSAPTWSARTILDSRAQDEPAAQRRENAAQGASPGCEDEHDQAPTGRKNHSQNTPQSPDMPTIIFANEFFDAFSVEVLSAEGKLFLGERDGRFVETWAPPATEELDLLDRYGVHPEAGERVEVSLAAQDYMSKLAASVKRGFIIIIDYGYTRPELLAGRHRGTVTAFRQHSVSADSYEAPGEQDITSHVNFTALAAAAELQGMYAHSLVTQSQFLLGIGEHNQFADAFEDCRLPQERAKVALQLKHLITPEGMGESFQVLVGSKGVEASRTRVLRGLSFGK
jgi:SAM-dependent MidA family methyltransferase